MSELRHLCALSQCMLGKKMGRIVLHTSHEHLVHRISEHKKILHEYSSATCLFDGEIILPISESSPAISNHYQQK
jgi:hypothetical protein